MTIDVINETNHQLDKVSSDTESFAVKFPFLFYFDFLIKTCWEENFRAMIKPCHKTSSF